MLNWLSADVNVHGTRLHYYRTGGAKPPLVLVHGLTDDGLCWTPVAEVLAGDYDVILLDTRGHGRSAASEGACTLTDLAGDLAGLIQVLDLKAPVVLGHSLGAITALVLAGLFPDLPRAIMLEDPPAYWSPVTATPEAAAQLQGLVDWIKSNKRKTRADLLAEARANSPAWSEAELDPWADSKHRYSLQVLELLTPGFTAGINWPELLGRVTCPVLFIAAGPALGAASQPAQIAELKQRVPHLQVAGIPDAGHSIRRDQFARYLAVVQPALRAYTGG